MTDLRDALATHRPDLLRHCYRMLGSFADAEDVVQDVLLKALRAQDTYAGDAPLSHWLMRIATNACLDELARRKVRTLPSIDRAPSAGDAPIVEGDAAEWITPAPDRRLFESPQRALELRESVALAFLAILQRLPARQRAVLLLKDIVEMSAEEIAAALEMSVPAVSSALHRARESLGGAPEAPASDPPPDVLRSYLRSWEEHDVDAMIALMRDDIVFSMPPHATWFRGRADVERFLRGARFTAHWSAGYRVLTTRANAVPALAFHRRVDGRWAPSSLQIVRWTDGAVAEVTAFVGAAYLAGFDLPAVE